MVKCIITAVFLIISISGSAPHWKSYQIGPGDDSRPARPNIIFILVDDMGWMDAGFMGSSYYETPNIDRLATQGMQFTNAYAAAANCAPSRACLMSGRNTPSHGIFTVGNPDRGPAASRKLIPARNNTILPDSITTLAERLQALSYHTSIFGKWHLGPDAETQGFDLKVGGNHKGLNKYFPPYENPDIKDGPEGEYLTDRLTTEAIKTIEKQKGLPFFVYLSYFAVHTPLEAPKELIEKYQNKPVIPRQNNPVYAAMIESLDSNIGRLLNTLDELGIADNTLIIFTSDNGGIRAISNQAPLRAGKGSYYEGGIRVPLIVRWPGKIPAGSKTNIPVTNLDFYPTILDILNVKDELPDLDGVSIFPVLKGQGLAPRPLFWHFPVYLQAYDENLDDGRDPQFRTRPGSVVRWGKWKLHEYFEDNTLELYDLERDIGERNNLAEQYPGLVKELHGMLINWRTSSNAPVPRRLNPAYKTSVPRE